MLPIFPIMLLLITTGNATSESVVNTQVEGETATVETRIYTNVNGNESTVTSDKPGEIRVVNDGKAVRVTTPTITETVATMSAEKVEMPQLDDTNPEILTFRRFVESLARWLSKLFGK